MLQRISISDLWGFGNCRRRWFWESVAGYTSKTPPTNLWFGSCVHAGLEAYYVNGRDANKLLEGFTSSYDETFEKVKSDYPDTFQSLVPEMQSHYKLGIGMLENYLRYEQDDHQLEGDIAGVEVKLERPIFSDGRLDDPVLVGKIDLVIQKENGDVWLVDHKTYKSHPNFAGLDLDDQITGYCYLVWKLYGVVPTGFIYNVLIKTVPEFPRTLSNGKGLSRDKTQSTTGSLYREAIRQAGLKESDYADILAYYDSNGYKPFFERGTTLRSIHELESFEKRIRVMYDQMKEGLIDTSKLYPNPTSMNCAWCPMLQPCKEYEAGGDYQYLLTTNYDRRDFDQRLELSR